MLNFFVPFLLIHLVAFSLGISEIYRVRCLNRRAFRIESIYFVYKITVVLYERVKITIR